VLAVVAVTTTIPKPLRSLPAAPQVVQLSDKELLATLAIRYESGFVKQDS
jgi:hypothetical protein